MSMILVLHILVAMSSIVVATLAAVLPSRAKLQLTYGLVTATLTSGTFLIMVSHAPIVSSCFSGLVYIAIVSALSRVARQRLAKQNA